MKNTHLKPGFADGCRLSIYSIKSFEEAVRSADPYSRAEYDNREYMEPDPENDKDEVHCRSVQSRSPAGSTSPLLPYCSAACLRCLIAYGRHNRQRTRHADIFPYSDCPYPYFSA